jgi:hypothetical protein
MRKKNQKSIEKGKIVEDNYTNGTLVPMSGFGSRHSNKYGTIWILIRITTLPTLKLLWATVTKKNLDGTGGKIKLARPIYC